MDNDDKTSNVELITLCGNKLALNEQYILLMASIMILLVKLNCLFFIAKSVENYKLEILFPMVRFVIR